MVYAIFMFQFTSSPKFKEYIYMYLAKQPPKPRKELQKLFLKKNKAKITGFYLITDSRDLE